MGAALFHSWPVAALGGASYLALVAWDIAGKNNASPSRPPKFRLPKPSDLADPQAKATVSGILAARVELERVLEETPEQVRSHLDVALAQLAELEERAARLLERGEELYKYLAKTDANPVRKEAERLAKKAEASRDADTKAEYERARAAREEQLRALDDINSSKERVAANLSRIAATLESMPAKVVRMRALDAEGMDSLTGDLNSELEDVNGEIKSFEEALKSFTEKDA